MTTDKYFNYTRTDIAPLVPSSVHRVLEIGCGSGNTLTWLKELKQCSWVGGIDISPDAINRARPKLNEAFCMDIEKNEIPIPENDLDLILCLDVLEHLVDPWSVVKRLHKLLKRRGALIASIPNVRNREVLFPLLFKGKWDYTDAGFLDKTHLRFFVRETAIQLIASSGLTVDCVASTGLGKSPKSQMINRHLPPLIRSLFEKQYLIRAIRFDQPF